MEKIKLKLRQIWDSQAALPKVTGKEITAKIAYWISRNTKKIEAELRSLNEARIKLVKELGKEDERKMWEVLPENREKFTEEFEKLLDQDIEIEIRKIKLAELGEVKLSSQEISAIDFMIDEA